MRVIPCSALLAAALMATAPLAVAQQAPAQSPQAQSPQDQPLQVQPGESTGDALADNPEVVESQGPMPDETGTRAPEAQQTEMAPNPLIQAMRAVTKAPPDLQGNPVQRPNDLASEPVAHSK